MQDRAPQEVLGHLQQLILGLAGVADVAKQAAVLQSSTFLGRLSCCLYRCLLEPTKQMGIEEEFEMF